MTSTEVKAMRRFTTLALALVVLASGAAYASGAGSDSASGERTRGSAGAADFASAGDSAAASPAIGIRVGPSELKAALVRQEFADSTIEFVMSRVHQFAVAYVRGVRAHSARLEGLTLEDVIERKFIPALGYTTPELIYHPENGSTETHVAQPVWDRMDPNTQTIVRRTVTTEVDELLNEGSSDFGMLEGGKQ